MQIKITNEQGVAQESALVASDAVLGCDYNESLIHQIVVAYQANGRQGTRAQKGRSQIAKSTRKPWRQKGTGRARAGMASSPLWRGGGKIFPSMPDENFTQKINRKMYRAGLCSILSQLVREEKIAFVESLSVDSPKTKVFAQKLKQMGLDRVLIITDILDENLYLSSRNLPNVLVLTAEEMDPVSLVRYPKIIMTTGALKRIEENLL